MKTNKQWIKQIQLSYMENKDMIIDATIQTQRFLSGIIFFTLLFYFILISMTDYMLWKTWNNQHLYTLIIAFIACINWIIYFKPIISKNKVIITTNCFIFILLISFAAGRAMGGGYISYTLAVCATVSTIVLSLNPIHYSFLALIAMLSEIFFNYQYLGGDFVTILYYGVDAFVIFAVTSCLNFFFSLLRYEIFNETNALKTENSIDQLTGLYNRKYLEHYFRFHYREDELSALLHIDLDNFKTVNDTLGHQEGDKLLINVSQILHDNFRNSDCVARIGGDEFMIFMPTLSETKHTYEKVHNLLGKFPILVEKEGKAQPVPVSISIGVVFSTKNEACSYSQLYEKADNAMYQAKKSGKGKAVFCDTKSEKTTVLEFGQNLPNE